MFPYKLQVQILQLNGCWIYIMCVFVFQVVISKLQTTLEPLLDHLQFSIMPFLPLKEVNYKIYKARDVLKNG